MNQELKLVLINGLERTFETIRFDLPEDGNKKELSEAALEMLVFMDYVDQYGNLNPEDLQKWKKMADNDKIKLATKAIKNKI